ncbi:glutathione S-transferase family protein [Rhodoblastus acidophilus]|uniref:Glutathione S-transferase family protein n=1 Tax=Candidatus Rhodoblastus alkanivorans TaxID=2954117 RepID=A0ABS9Z0W0_9HYPH|nr:glutathione S-transferase family protein [Candidatus Rhodoblastus alkanivorans]MCI4678244.1 glutathione S-transferase family protein [Candidatus Rhodoblastus alkanivorans]MCI4681294.1 glutathione S-transferase family protein [Candidatus Rhodoblastus alkanivorans]MDI4642341.1 glutathione S-transferase family protein [Rhodoblastus acidophilus]
MAKAVLTISSKNYSSWCLRGWLLCKMAGLDFEEKRLPIDDPDARAELLLLSPSFLTPALDYNGLHVWDTLALGEYLAETFPKAQIFPKDIAARTHNRSVSGEMHSGFNNLRSALPMNIKAHFPNFRVWSGAKPDIDRVCAIWRDCLSRYGGPFLFGKRPTLADAMFAPVCSRFATYDLTLDSECAGFRDQILGWEPMAEWAEAAKVEPDEMEELDVEF